jgi:hypothetical protein
VISASISCPPSPKALPTFDIEFEVPCGVAVQDVTLHSSNTWTLFVMKVSEVMGCSHNALPPLGYIPSWKPAKAKASPKILDGPETFAKLVKEAQEMIAESKAKNKGKGIVKAWSIQLVDLYKAETNSGKVSLFRMCSQYRLISCRLLRRPKRQLLHLSQSTATKLKSTKLLRKSRRPMNAMLILAMCI